MNPELTTRLIARVRVRVGEFIDAGTIPEGHRRIIPIAAGIVEGPRIRGEVVPLGADWNLVRADGTETVSARYAIRTDDGWVLSVLNEGVIANRSIGRYGITALRIEAPRESPYADLNDAVIVGSLGVEEDAEGLLILLEYWQAQLAGDEA